MKSIKVGLIGFGTVGQGVYELLQKNQAIISNRCNQEIQIQKILVRDIQKHQDKTHMGSLLTDDPDVFFKVPMDIVIEVMGGIDQAFFYVKKSLENKMHVVTANKDLMAEKGCHLMDIAKQHQKSLRFEAAVCAGLPIVGMIRENFVANQILSFLGIFNGTTNYILTQMEKNHLSFDQALDLAKESGYAEADPTNDIKGYDTARKTAILAGIAFDANISLKDIHTEGIEQIQKEDIDFAKELGYRIRLLGMCKEVNGQIKAQVNPVLIPLNHPLANIQNEYNGVYIQTDAMGPSMIYGKGAGALPTASGILGDVIAIMRNLSQGDPIGCTCHRKLPLRDIQTTHSNFYIRLKVKKDPHVLTQISHVFENNHVDVYSMVQKNLQPDFSNIMIITHKVMEKNIQNSLSELSNTSGIQNIDALIRVEQENEWSNLL